MTRAPNPERHARLTRWCIHRVGAIRGLAFDERELGAIVLGAVVLVLPVMIVFAIAFFYLASVS